jgi:uncharacterized protein YdhG (YjbR/CyaY superfamily)
MMTGKRRWEDVDHYLSSLPRGEKEVLEDLRRIIKETAPEVEEMISYGIPTYKLNGPLVHFKTGKNHLSLITTSRTVVESLKADLEGFGISGTTIHFSVDNPLPTDLVRKIIEARVRELRNI